MNTPRTLAVVGAGGHGRVVADSAAASGWSCIRFFDDRFPQSTEAGPWPIVGKVSAVVGSRSEFDAVIVAIGTNKIRAEMTRAFGEAGLNLATVIHPRAFVSPYSSIRPGCFLAPGAMVNIGAQIGPATIVNTSATIDHDCEIGEGVHVSPGAHVAGGVTVGALAWVGIGASVREGISIGARCTIGAGAAVVSNIDDDVVAVGCPAKPRAADA